MPRRRWKQSRLSLLPVYSQEIMRTPKNQSTSMAWTEDLLRVQIWLALVTADVSATRIHLQIFPLITSDNIYNWESFYSSTSNDWVLTLTNQQTVFWPSLCGSVPSEDRKWFRHPSVGYAEPTNGRPASPPPRSGKTPNGLLHQLITLLDKRLYLRSGANGLCK